MKKELYVTCAQGLESLLLAELQELGIKDARKGFRGAYVPYEKMETLYLLNYCLRLASRVLLPLSSFKCYDSGSLYRGISAIDWLPYIPKNKTFAIDANVTHPRLRNSLYAAQVAKDAICDQFVKATGSRPNIDTYNPGIQLNLYIRDQIATISFDTSGLPLHKRGYRVDAGEAPIQETMAAALLRLAGIETTDVICDPCCGSGTLLIEAALILSHTAPGYLRKTWGFNHLPDFSNDEWLKVKAEVDRQRIPLLSGKLFGCDVSREAVRISRVNLKAAGFHKEIEISQYDFREFSPSTPPSVVIVNPPHGRRLEETDTLIPLYRALGDFLKCKIAKPGRGYVFTGNLELAKEVGLAPKRRHVLYNNGIESRFLEFEIY